MDAAEKASGCYPPESGTTEEGLHQNEREGARKSHKSAPGSAIIAITICAGVLVLALIAGAAIFVSKRRCKKYAASVQDVASTPPLVAKDAKNAIEDRSALSGTSQGKP